MAVPGGCATRDAKGSTAYLGDRQTDDRLAMGGRAWASAGRFSAGVRVVLGGIFMV